MAARQMFHGIFVLSLAGAAVTAAINGGCYYLPGDKGWPSTVKWDQLNATVGGRLIKTVPIGAVCHEPSYDEAACNFLQANWDEPDPQ